MNQPFIIGQFSFPEDYPGVLDLWRNSGDGIQLRESDEAQEIQKKILRDPDLFLVARAENKIIGAVMGGFDGRRGYVYHLAVSPAYRNLGIARQLMAEIEARLKSKGCLKVNLFVTQNNLDAMAFYENDGYQPMKVVAFGKKLI